MASNQGRITQREMPLCRGEGERRGWRLIGVKMHGRKSVQGLAMARREFGKLTGGELTRFDCTDKHEALRGLFATAELLVTLNIIVS